jgi:uncharacterized membrane protein
VNKHWRLLLAGAALLATALRAFRLDGQSMWFDEAARLLIARLDPAAILSNAGGDTLPPLYHLAAHAWGTLGQADFWLRLPSLFAGVTLVAAVFSLGRQLGGRRAGLVAAFFTAVAPYQIFHAQQANLYALLVLFAALQMLFFWLGYRRGRFADWLGFILFAAAGFFTHYFAALVTLTAHIYFVLNPRRWPEIWPSLALADGLLLLICLPQLTTFWHDLEGVSAGFWIPRPGPLAPLTTIYLFLASYSLPAAIAPLALFAVFLFLAMGALDLLATARRRPESRPPLLYLLLLTLLPIALVWIISQWVPLFLDRTLIIVTPALFVLAARMVTAARPRSPAPYLAGVTVVIGLVAVVHYYGNPQFWKPDYRQAAAFLASRQAAGEAVVHTSNGSYIPFLFYQALPDHYLLTGDPAPHHPPRLHLVAGGAEIDAPGLGGYERLWLVVALEHSIDWQRAQAEAVAGRYRELERHSIGGIEIVYYERGQ